MTSHGTHVCMLDSMKELTLAIAVQYDSYDKNDCKNWKFLNKGLKSNNKITVSHLLITTITFCVTRIRCKSDKSR